MRTTRLTLSFNCIKLALFKIFNSLSFLFLCPLKVFVFVANLHRCSQDLIYSWDARCLNRLLDQDFRELWEPIKEPFVVTVRQKELQEVRQAFEILLMVVVVGTIDYYSILIDVTKQALIILALSSWDFVVVLLFLHSANAVSQINLFDIFNERPH